jgi:two-component system cell cycle response regulator
MPAAIRLAMLGFSAFERDVLRVFFRLAPGHGYEVVESLADARLVIVDTDAVGAVGAVVAAGRVADAVFVGTQAPPGAVARLPRPVDALLVLRELDALAGRPLTEPSPPVPPHAETHELYAVEPSEVLVVDDDVRARQWLGRTLAQLGLRATLAEDGHSALEHLAHRRPAFVLIAVELGGGDDDGTIDGLALCRRIKRETRAAYGPPSLPPPVVLLSDDIGASERVLGQLAGCDAYLAQPVDPALLARTLAALQPALFGLSGGARRRTRPHRQ